TNGGNATGPTVPHSAGAGPRKVSRTPHWAVLYAACPSLQPRWYNVGMDDWLLLYLAASEHERNRRQTNPADDSDDRFTSIILLACFLLPVIAAVAAAVALGLMNP
ncbi:MAG: hypothetical protein ACP5O7_10975, partial [Phycisphaerae bacterium]